MSQDWQPKNHPVHYLIDLTDRIRAIYDTFFAISRRDEKALAAGRVQIREDLNAIHPLVWDGPDRCDAINRCVTHFVNLRSKGGEVDVRAMRRELVAYMGTLDAMVCLNPIRDHELTDRSAPREEKEERIERYKAQYEMIGQAAKLRQRLLDFAADAGEYISATIGDPPLPIAERKPGMKREVAFKRAVELEQRFGDKFLRATHRVWATAIGCSETTAYKLQKDAHFRSRRESETATAPKAVGFSTTIEATYGVLDNPLEELVRREDEANREKLERERASVIGDHRADERLENNPSPRRRKA